MNNQVMIDEVDAEVLVRMQEGKDGNHEDSEVAEKW